jgi:hypothetical protein
LLPSFFHRHTAFVTGMDIATVAYATS